MIAYRFLPDGEEERGSLTYGELYRRARQIAAELQTISAVGQRALLLDSSELDFIIALRGFHWIQEAPSASIDGRSV